MRLAAQIECYHDPAGRPGIAAQAAEQRMRRLDADLQGFRTLVVDSITGFEQVTLQAQKHIYSPRPDQALKRYGEVAEASRDMFLCRLAGLDLCVVVTAHVGHTKDEVTGGVMREPLMFGKVNPRKIGAFFSEVHRSYVARTDAGERAYMLQTACDDVYMASSQVSAPDPCPSVYAALFGGGVPEPVHTLVYGDPGSGKSTYAATYPQPMLVLLFDPLMKERPYRKLGTVVEEGNTAEGMRMIRISRENGKKKKEKVEEVKDESANTER